MILKNNENDDFRNDQEVCHLYDLEESASHPSPSPRGSAPSSGLRGQGSALTSNIEFHMARRTCFREQYYTDTRRYYVSKCDGGQYPAETIYTFGMVI